MFYRSEVIFERYAEAPSCHCASIVELENKDILAVWYAGSREGARDVAIYGSRLKYGSEKWSRVEMIVDTPNLPEGNPVLFRDSNNVIWLFYVTMYGRGWETCKIKYIVSEDNGLS